MNPSDPYDRFWLSVAYTFLVAVVAGVIAGLVALALNNEAADNITMFSIIGGLLVTFGISFWLLGRK